MRVRREILRIVGADGVGGGAGSGDGTGFGDGGGEDATPRRITPLA